MIKETTGNTYDAALDCMGFHMLVTDSGSDYTTPSVHTVSVGDSEVEVMVPLIPARSNDKDGYIAEMQAAGFIVERLVEMDTSNAIQYSATIYVVKP